MAQFTLKQLLLATTCFAVSFAGLGGFVQLRGWDAIPYLCVFVGGMVSGVGALRGHFWIYLALAISVPVAVSLLQLASSID
jgi:hypothetical protein